MTSSSEKLIAGVARKLWEIQGEFVQPEEFAEVLRELGIAELIEAAQERRKSIAVYANTLMARYDGKTADDYEITAAIKRYMDSTESYDAALAAVKKKVGI